MVRVEYEPLVGTILNETDAYINRLNSQKMETFSSVRCKSKTLRQL